MLRWKRVWFVLCSPLIQGLLGGSVVYLGLWRCWEPSSGHCQFSAHWENTHVDSWNPESRVQQTRGQPTDTSLCSHETHFQIEYLTYVCPLSMMLTPSPNPVLSHLQDEKNTMLCITSKAMDHYWGPVARTTNFEDWECSLPECIVQCCNSDGNVS